MCEKCDDIRTSALRLHKTVLTAYVYCIPLCILQNLNIFSNFGGRDLEQTSLGANGTNQISISVAHFGKGLIPRIHQQLHAIGTSALSPFSSVLRQIDPESVDSKTIGSKPTFVGSKASRL